MDFFLFVALKLFKVSPGYGFTVFNLFVKTIKEVIPFLVDDLSISSGVSTVSSFDPLIIRVIIDNFY